MKKILLSVLLATSLYSLEVGEILPAVILSGDDGSKVTGETFDTQSMKGKLSLIFYVDPDEKEVNEHVSKAIKAHSFDKTHFQSYAIINMAATWLPNFAISNILEEKQKEYAKSIYVKDLKKNFVYMWKVADDSSNIILVDKNSKVLFIQEGEVNDARLKELISLIDANS